MREKGEREGKDEKVGDNEKKLIELAKTEIKNEKRGEGKKNQERK